MILDEKTTKALAEALAASRRQPRFHDIEDAIVDDVEHARCIVKLVGGSFSDKLRLADAVHLVRSVRAGLSREATLDALAAVVEALMPPAGDGKLPGGVGDFVAVAPPSPADLDPTDAELESAATLVRRAAEAAHRVGLTQPDGEMLSRIVALAKDDAQSRAWREAMAPKPAEPAPAETDIV